MAQTLPKEGWCERSERDFPEQVGSLNNLKMMKTPKTHELTMEDLLAIRKAPLLWSRPMMRKLGIMWPPKRDDLKKAVGAAISAEDYEKLKGFKKPAWKKRVDQLRKQEVAAKKKKARRKRSGRKSLSKAALAQKRADNQLRRSGVRSAAGSGTITRVNRLGWAWDPRKACSFPAHEKAAQD